MLDYLHLLLSILPKQIIATFMGYLKGKSAIMIFQILGLMVRVVSASRFEQSESQRR